MNKNGDFYRPLYVTCIICCAEHATISEGMVGVQYIFRFFFVFSRILDTEKIFKNLWNFKQQVKFGRILEQY